MPIRVRALAAAGVLTWLAVTAAATCVTAGISPALGALFAGASILAALYALFVYHPKFDPTTLTRWRGPSTGGMIALTFDDGPGPYTQSTLDTLKAAGAKASFFLVGRLMDTSTNQRESRAEAKFGDVGDHSWNHFGLAGESRSTLESEIVRPRNTIQKYSGEQPLFFRPPWGSRDSALDAFVKSQGMIEMMWTFDTHDSEGAKADEIVNTIFNQVRPGSIILMHENRGTTREALPAILQILTEKGLQPVTLTTLLTKDPPTTKQLKDGLPACFGG